jgi:hypothetical protein
MRFTLRSLFLGVALLACGLGCVAGMFRLHVAVERGENVARVHWLPKSAANVSYYRSYKFTAYEFDIPEADFIAWSQWSLRPITSGKGVKRYNYRDVLAEYPGIDPYMSHADEIEARRWARISSGLYYEERWAGQGGVTVAYDRSKGRAYFQSSPR